MWQTTDVKSGSDNFLSTQRILASIVKTKEQSQFNDEHNEKAAFGNLNRYGTSMMKIKNAHTKYQTKSTNKYFKKRDSKNSSSMAMTQQVQDVLIVVHTPILEKKERQQEETKKRTKSFNNLEKETNKFIYS
jgi:hypothetical protein